MICGPYSVPLLFRGIRTRLITIEKTMIANPNFIKVFPSGNPFMIITNPPTIDNIANTLNIITATGSNFKKLGIGGRGSEMTERHSTMNLQRKY